jgi:hypothetical protein
MTVLAEARRTGDPAAGDRVNVLGLIAARRFRCLDGRELTVRRRLGRVAGNPLSGLRDDAKRLALGAVLLDAIGAPDARVISFGREVELLLFVP